MKTKVNIIIGLMAFLFSSCTNFAGTIYDIHIFEDTPVWELAVAIDKSQFKKARKIVSDHPELIDYKDPKYGTTLLWRNIALDRYKTVKFLLENGANPNLKVDTGSSPIFRSVGRTFETYGDSKTLKILALLLQYGADPNTTYCGKIIEGQTDPTPCTTSVLMQGVYNIKSARLLVDAGADINYKSNTWRTAAINALTNIKVESAHFLIVEKKANVVDPYYRYKDMSFQEPDFDRPPMYPIELLENWLFEPGSKEHKFKLEIIEEFQRQGQDY